MITGRIIIGLAVFVLLIQSLPLSHTDDALYNNDSSEICIHNVAHDDGGDCSDFVLPEYIIPDQPITLTNRFYTDCKILPGFPVCIYINVLTDILTPPPDKAV